MEDVDPVALVFIRNAYYRRQYFLALGVFILSLFVMLVLSIMLIYVLNHPTKPLYFATDNVGRLLKVVPISEPNMTEEEVVKWAKKAVESAYSYDYINYRSQLQNTQKYFSDYGWQKYLKALEASNNLVALKQRKMIVTAKVVKEPTVITKGLLSGAYAWKYQMPVLVTYSQPPYDDSSKFSNALNVTVIVQRQSILKSYHGLGILQIIGSVSSEAPPTQPISEMAR